MAIPWQLRIVIIMNRKAGLNLLVHAATEAIQQWARDIKGMRMGILIVIHTFGADMKWHPHKKRWKYQVTTRMKKAHRERQWRFPKSKDFFKQYPLFAAMINKLWKITWFAYIGASLLDPRFSIQYIGRYTKRAVMAEYRIIYYDGKIIRFSYKDDADTNIQTSWAERQTEYIGINPLQCPNCDKPLTFVGSLFGNWSKLQYLFVKAGKDSTIAAALLRPG